MPAASFRFRVHLLGALALAGYLALTLLSYVQAPALWQHEDAVRAVAFFDGLAAWIPAIGYYKAFSGPGAVIASYWLPLALPTLAAALLLLLLQRPDVPDDGIADLIFKWSLAFALACTFAYPVFTQDFWLSAVWGQMIASGSNPYYQLFTPERLAGLPLDHFPMVMSYGPLWGILSGMVMEVAGSHLLATAIAFKAVLAAAWIGGLVLVAKIMQGRPAHERCLALAAYGWTPASVSQALAEGHNDIVMVSLGLLWFFLLLRGSLAAPAALACSVLCKYVTAPLILIDALYVLRRERLPWSDFCARLLGPALLGLCVLAAFFRSMEFFDGLKVIGAWHFLQPRDAVAALEQMSGLPLAPLRYAVVALFPLLALYQLAVSYWSPTIPSLQRAAIAIMAAITFSGVSHVWPWYVIWALAPAVLEPRWWLSRLVVGVALLVPFTLATWWIDVLAEHREVAALLMYLGAGAWAFAAGNIPAAAGLPKEQSLPAAAGRRQEHPRRSQRA